MPVKRQISEPDGVFFITFTCHQWKPLIEIIRGYDLVYTWFNHLKSKGHYIVGFVIMPNHVHALIAFRNSAQSINTIVGNGKRFLAYEIIKDLKNKKKKYYCINYIYQLRQPTEKEIKSMRFGKIRLTGRNAERMTLCIRS